MRSSSSSRWATASTRHRGAGWRTPGAPRGRQRLRGRPSRRDRTPRRVASRLRRRDCRPNRDVGCTGADGLDSGAPIEASETENYLYYLYSILLMIGGSDRHRVGDGRTAHAPEGATATPDHVLNEVQLEVTDVLPTDHPRSEGSRVPAALSTVVGIPHSVSDPASSAKMWRKWVGIVRSRPGKTSVEAQNIESTIRPPGDCRTTSDGSSERGRQ